MGKAAFGTVIELPGPLATRIIAQAEREAPREACGLIAVDAAGDAVEVFETTNVDPGLDRFEIDPAEHHAAIVACDAKGWTLAGVYHSHPRGPAGLSETDLEAPIDGDWTSFIVSPGPDGWQISGYHVGLERSRHRSLR